jgi:D-3-phosphoglycerate dehydrogenase
VTAKNRVVAILGTRYADFGIETEVLAPAAVEIRSSVGGDRADIVSVAADAEVILAGSGPKFDADTLAALSCRGIVRYGVGTESIDLDAARQRGIWVSRVADYGTEAVATHAVTLAMAALRRLREADARVRSGHWGFAPLRPLHLPSASTVGLVGFGRIGQHAARQFVGIGFSVLAYDPLASVEGRVAGVQSASLEELLSRSDVVSLHLPGNPDGSPLFDAAMLARLKPGSILVNTARGSLIDGAGLLRGLNSDRPAIAALDVFPTEPPEPAFLAEVGDKMLLSPHMAWYTEESEHDLRMKAAAEALRLLRGERPHEVVVVPLQASPSGSH